MFLWMLTYKESIDGERPSQCAGCILWEKSSDPDNPGDHQSYFISHTGHFISATPLAKTLDFTLNNIKGFALDCCWADQSENSQMPPTGAAIALHWSFNTLNKAAEMNATLRK